LCTFDQEPEHDRQFAEQNRLREVKCRAVVGWREQRDGAENHIGETIDHEPDSDPARQKSGAINEKTEWKEPQTPKQFIDKRSFAVQADKEHAKRIALCFIHNTQEVRAAKQ